MKLLKQRPRERIDVRCNYCGVRGRGKLRGFCSVGHAARFGFVAVRAVKLAWSRGQMRVAIR